ncbi:MAG: aquaporin [Ignavibacteriaceae bacterium]
MNKKSTKIPWTLFASEFIGTALLVLVGLSFVILDFGKGSFMISLIPDAGTRRLITGFLFGSTGALIAVSWIGKESGAHINPAVTLAFWSHRKITFSHAAGYIFSQLTGSILGALPLLLWGKTGSSVYYGATFPGSGDTAWTALLGELLTTFAMVLLLFIFVGNKKLRNYTPLIFPVLYSIMVFAEAPVSGTSTNPARTLGPAVISGYWSAWWVYWIGPAAGALAAVAFYKFSWFKKFKIEVAKLYHFELDRHGIFKKFQS